MDSPLRILFINHVAPLSGLPSPRGGAVCAYRIAGAAERDRRELEDDPCNPSVAAAQPRDLHTVDAPRQPPTSSRREPRQVTIGVVGRLARWKTQHVFLEAFTAFRCLEG